MGKVSTPRSTIRYSGLFDFDGLYAAIIDWAKNYGYMWHEVDYKHKVPSPAGAEQEWKWSLIKRISKSHRYEILFTLHSWDLQEVVVEYDNKKKTLTKGRIYIWIDATFFSDTEERFKGTKMKEWMGKVYGKIYDPETGELVDTLHYRVLNLQALMKKFFEMQTQKNPYKGYLNED